MFIKKIFLKRIIFVFLPIFILCNPLSINASPAWVVTAAQVFTCALQALQAGIEIYKNSNSSSKEEDKESKKIDKDSSSNTKTKSISNSNSDSDSDSNSNNRASNLLPLTKGGERPTISPSWFSSLEDDIFKQAKLIKETTEKLKKANTKPGIFGGASDYDKRMKNLEEQIDKLKDMLSSPSKNVSQKYEKTVIKDNSPIDEDVEKSNNEIIELYYALENAKSLINIIHDKLLESDNQNCSSVIEDYELYRICLSNIISMNEEFIKNVEKKYSDSIKNHITDITKRKKENTDLLKSFQESDKTIWKKSIYDYEKQLKFLIEARKILNEQKTWAEENIIKFKLNIYKIDNIIIKPFNTTKDKADIKAICEKNFLNISCKIPPFIEFYSLEDKILKQVKLINETNKKMNEANAKRPSWGLGLVSSEREKKAKELEEQINTLKNMLSSPSKNVSLKYEKTVIKDKSSIEDVKQSNNKIIELYYAIENAKSLINIIHNKLSKFNKNDYSVFIKDYETYKTCLSCIILMCKDFIENVEKKYSVLIETHITRITKEKTEITNSLESAKVSQTSNKDSLKTSTNMCDNNLKSLNNAKNKLSEQKKWVEEILKKLNSNMSKIENTIKTINEKKDKTDIEKTISLNKSLSVTSKNPPLISF